MIRRIPVLPRSGECSCLGMNKGLEDVKKIYTGIGSRNTPEPALQQMVQIGQYLAKIGYTLRSGAAQGADSAFEEGCNQQQGLSEIYLPFEGFNKHTSPLFPPSRSALGLALNYHQNRDRLPSIAQKLMARNVHQILGMDLNTPTDFVICWTIDGCTQSSERTSKTGGTGLAIDIASDWNIPIINLKNPGWKALLAKELHSFTSPRPKTPQS